MTDHHFDLVFRSTAKGVTFKYKATDDPASTKAVEAVNNGHGLHDFLAQQHVHEENLARIKATSPLGYATAAGVVAVGLGIGTSI